MWESNVCEKQKAMVLRFAAPGVKAGAERFPPRSPENELAEMQVFLLLKIGRWNAGYELDRGFKYIQYIYLCFWGDVI